MLDRTMDGIEHALRTAPLVKRRGRVVGVTGSLVRAAVGRVGVGDLCRLEGNGAHEPETLAEVVGFEGHDVLLSPLGTTVGISAETPVAATGRRREVAVGDGLLGRVLDGLGRPLDGGPADCRANYPVLAEPPDPMQRKVIDTPLGTGVRVLDGLLTCGEGQRMGIFAAAGGGKSTLLSMLIRNAAADVKVLALIGERGREVREFIEQDIGAEGLKQSVVVVATSERPAMERLKAAYVATAIAEYFRDRDMRVLLMMDSVTRFARAQREIGLAAGEPPTRRGFPPSVFAALPQLMERAGQSDAGSITALYTVLVEGDDMTEPVADETRSILDGHIILSRSLAQANHYPAVDVLASVSRVMNHIVGPDHLRVAGRARELLAKYREVELLVRIGEYKRGADALADEAIDRVEPINAVLKQGMFERSSLEETTERLRQAVGG
ncbi:MAG: EscN/YscN/HrcN family type III secretion system ATPase [Gammaproteobacteria bacterium]|nr:EscN/YscN/HrcN family type III secretion system ATPase [Gammaproteobacteria bacterium]MYF30150.1 EscN/YscN/HrcN family type III secretion system ATPase [Gammaproteobacteria bacterium]MYK44673.1 EscN/YscN/HrcN family type III secretion system ATPase [Gammaproteobacteria bacterium]